MLCVHGCMAWLWRRRALAVLLPRTRSVHFASLFELFLSSVANTAPL